MDRVSETQLQVGENIDLVIWQLKSQYCFINQEIIVYIIIAAVVIHWKVCSTQNVLKYHVMLISLILIKNVFVWFIFSGILAIVKYKLLQNYWTELKLCLINVYLPFSWRWSDIKRAQVQHFLFTGRWSFFLNINSFSNLCQASKKTNCLNSPSIRWHSTSAVYASF